MKVNMDNPDEEVLYCKECSAHFIVQWEYDEEADDFPAPNYCPFCANAVLGDEYDRELDEQEYDD